MKAATGIVLGFKERTKENDIEHQKWTPNICPEKYALMWNFRRQARSRPLMEDPTWNRFMDLHVEFPTSGPSCGISGIKCPKSVTPIPQ